MSTRRRYRASSLRTRTSFSAGLLGTSIQTSSYRNREPSNYSSSNLVNPRSVATDVSTYNRRGIHSLTAKEKSYQNKHFSFESKLHDQVDKDNHGGDIPGGEKEPFKDLSSNTVSPAQPECHPDIAPVEEDVNPLTEMEIKSAAQWRAVSGRVSWNLEKPERLEKQVKDKRTRGRKRITAKPQPRDRNRYK